MPTTKGMGRDRFNGIMAGTSTGEILLINIEPQQKLHQSGKHQSGKAAFMPYRIEKRLLTDKQRQCNCIAWNPLQKNLVAAGYELVKGEQKSCLLVWDINHQSQREKNNP